MQNETITLDDLPDALQQLQQRVRDEPACLSHRVALAQLLSASGQWQRAAQQLAHLGKADAAYQRFSRLYTEAIHGEERRTSVFEGRTLAHLRAKAPEWLRQYAQLFQQHAGVISETFMDDVPAIGGMVDETPFDVLLDGDSRIGPVFETILEGEYTWLAQEEIREVRFYPPKTVHDLIWRQAVVKTVDGVEHPALVPARYSGSEQRETAHALARKTEWLELPDQRYHGIGQRVLYADDADYSMLQINRLVFSDGR